MYYTQSLSTRPFERSSDLRLTSAKRRGTPMIRLLPKTRALRTPPLKTTTRGPCAGCFLPLVSLNVDLWFSDFLRGSVAPVGVAVQAIVPEAGFLRRGIRAGWIGVGLDERRVG